MSADNKIYSPKTHGTSKSYRSYVLLSLSFVYALNFIDRQILSILAEPVKGELGLRDWQIGFLTGTAFAIFYATLGIPIARLADRWHRVNVLSLCVGLWSFMTAACGLITNFAQLALMRVGVAIGEAGGSPTSASIISDYFPAEKRSSAMGIYTLGASIGTLGGFVIGGWVNEMLGWRWAFFIAGVPGILMALVVKLTVKEPIRGMSERAAVNEELPPFRSVFRTLWAIRSYRSAVLGATAASLYIYGVLVWVPIYTIRTFDVGTGVTGTAIGLIVGLAGGAGTLLGGLLADRLAGHGRDWPMRLAAITHVLSAPLFIAALAAQSFIAFIALLAPCYFLAVAYNGPVWAAMQSASPLRMRAMATAIFLLVLNLVGLGLGPQIVGILSDVFQARYGEDGLRLALAMLVASGVLGAWFFNKEAVALKAGDG